MRCPIFPANTLAFFSTAVVSRMCPHASWKITPPNAFPITTGYLPAGAYAAPSMAFAIRAASAPISSGGRSSKNSRPRPAPGLDDPVARSVPSCAMAVQAIRVLSRSSSAHSPSEFAISTRCTMSRYVTSTVRTAPTPAAAACARRIRASLRAFAACSGCSRATCMGVTSTRLKSSPPAPPASVTPASPRACATCRASSSSPVAVTSFVYAYTTCVPYSSRTPAPNRFPSRASRSSP